MPDTPRLSAANGGFTPLDAMSSNTSDLQLINIALNSLLFEFEVDDPMYSAHKQSNRMNLQGETRTYFVADSPMTIVSCQQQVSKVPHH